MHAVATATTTANPTATRLTERVRQLKQHIGGGNWLSALGNAHRSEAAALKAQTQLAHPNPKLQVAVERLRKQLATNENVRICVLEDELAMSMPRGADEMGLTERRIDQMLAPLETQLFTFGGCQVDRKNKAAAASPRHCSNGLPCNACFGSGRILELRNYLV